MVLDEQREGGMRSHETDVFLRHVRSQQNLGIPVAGRTFLEPNGRPTSSQSWGRHLKLDTGV